MTTAPRGRPTRLRRIRSLQLPVLVWLAGVWVALWGDLSLFNALTGLLVAVAVSLVFPLPRLELHLRIRPLRLGWLALRFLYDVVVSSVHVAAITLRPWRQPRNAVIEVQLRTPSDFVLTVVGEMSSLVPGSLVVEARRSTHTLFLHVLDAGDLAGVERMRRDVLALEHRVVMALGAQTDHLDPPDPATAPADKDGGTS